MTGTVSNKHVNTAPKNSRKLQIMWLVAKPELPKKKKKVWTVSWFQVFSEKKKKKELNQPVFFFFFYPNFRYLRLVYHLDYVLLFWFLARFWTKKKDWVITGSSPVSPLLSWDSRGLCLPFFYGPVRPSVGMELAAHSKIFYYSRHGSWMRDWTKKKKKNTNDGISGTRFQCRFPFGVNFQLTSASRFFFFFFFFLLHKLYIGCDSSLKSF